jgi:hypothetical protein
MSTTNDINTVLARFESLIGAEELYYNSISSTIEVSVHYGTKLKKSAIKRLEKDLYSKHTHVINEDDTIYSFSIKDHDKFMEVIDNYKGL